MEEALQASKRMENILIRIGLRYKLILLLKNRAKQLEYDYLFEVYYPEME
jgi:DNA-directed RNA polymerase subunit K/omega